MKDRFEKFGDDFERDLRSVFKTEPEMSVVEWFESSAGLVSIPYSPRPGRFSIESSPWLKEPMNACFDPLVRLVALMKPIQSGGSLMLEACVPFIAARSPAPCVVYTDNDANAKVLAETRLRPLLEACPSTAPLLPPRKEFQWNSFPVDRSHFWIRGSHNRRNLQGLTTRFVLGSETWLWKKGHIEEASKRVAAFKWLGKRIFESQAGWVDDDWDQLFRSTTSEEWSWECPHCSRVQPWEFRSLKFPEGAVTPEGFDFKILRRGMRLECSGCRSLFEDRDSVRNELNSRSRYIVTNDNALPENRGFHYSATCVREWGELAEEWARAKLSMNNGDEDPMRIFRQKQEAKSWSFSNFDSATEIPAGNFRRNEPWEEEGGFNLKTRKPETKFDPENKDLVRLRFISVDVQRDGFFCLCRGWNDQGESRLIDWIFLTTFDEVDEFRRKMSVIAPFVFIDCGDQTDTVQRQAARFGWNTTRGTNKVEFPWKVKKADGTFRVVFRPYSRPRIVESGKISCRVYFFGNLPFKDILFRLRRSGRHSYPHDAGEDYLSQMSAERRIKDASGRPQWKVTGRRANHLFDCEVIQILPALAFGLIGADAKRNAASEPEDPASAEREGSEPDDASDE